MISAVIPVYNTVAHELDEAISSLRAIKAVSEIILVDDHSNSLPTTQALQKYSEQGCKVIMSHHVRSVSGARATGVHKATYPYILLMDSDDTIYGEIKGPLAPINLSTNSYKKITLDHPLDYISHPQPLQWGAIVKKELMCLTSKKYHTDRYEDLGFGYRLMLLAWRDRLDIKHSGLHYKYRLPLNRNTVMSRHPHNEPEARKAYREYVSEAAIDFCPFNYDQIMNWVDRCDRSKPLVELVQTHPNARVDIHVLSYLEPWSSLRRTLKSLKTLPVNVYLVMGGFPGSIGAARAFAFTLGTAEYVSFIDDDDEIIPEAFNVCLEAIDSRPDIVGVYTDTLHVHSNGRQDLKKKGRPWNPVRQLMHASEVTHLKIMRRCYVEPYLNELSLWPTYEEYVLCGLMTEHGPWLHLPIAGARKHYKPASSSSMRLATRQLWSKAVARVTPTLMKRLKNM